MGSEQTQFKKGQSGNPHGRAVGFISKKEWLDKNLTEEMRIELMNSAYQRALHGKGSELIIFLLSRVLPPQAMDDAVEIKLRNKTHQQRGEEIFAALEEKRITPSQAHLLFSTLCDNVKLTEMTEIVERIKKLEEAQNAH